MVLAEKLIYVGEDRERPSTGVIMSVFTAFQPLSLTPSIISTAFSAFGGHPKAVVHTAAELEITNGPLELILHGTGFTYFGGPTHGPTSGIISSLQLNLFTPGYKFSHLSLPVVKLILDVNKGFHTGNFQPVLHDFLAGHDVINGSNGNDYLPDLGGHDRITGRAGDDVMTGGHGHDTFVFRPGFANDVINKFIAGSAANHDVIEMDHLGFHSVGQVKAASHIDGSGDLVIQVDASDSITLTSVHSKSALTAADFIFHA
jgi:Ca2+-binding RTX toxin-like protein